MIKWQGNQDLILQQHIIIVHFFLGNDGLSFSRKPSSTQLYYFSMRFKTRNLYEKPIPYYTSK